MLWYATLTLIQSGLYPALFRLFAEKTLLIAGWHLHGVFHICCAGVDANRLLRKFDRPDILLLNQAEKMEILLVENQKQCPPHDFTFA